MMNTAIDPNITPQGLQIYTLLQIAAAASC